MPALLAVKAMTRTAGANGQGASMAPYDLAREVAWFVVLVYVGIGVVLWLDWRKEVRGLEVLRSEGR